MVLAIVTALVTIVFFSLARIPQPQSYHHFADTRSLWNIPNFGDVVSNLPFAVIGLRGIVCVARQRHRSVCVFTDPRERWAYLAVFFGLLLTAVGSSYYHLHPDNARLVWDRIPMTIVFMSMVAAVITERIHVRVGLWLLPALLVTGVASVLRWYATELRAAGDLRFYAALQVYSGLILLIALLFPPRYNRGSDYAVVVAFYALAKALEMLDRQVFRMGYLVSGHTLKHLAAAMAGYWILRMVRMRHALPLRTPSAIAASTV